MLRVAPIRMPLVSHPSGWEEYTEEPTKDFENGKLFYFNRTTFEASYEEPYEVINDRAEAAQATINASVEAYGGYYDENDSWIMVEQAASNTPWGASAMTGTSTCVFCCTYCNTLYALCTL